MLQTNHLKTLDLKQYRFIFYDSVDWQSGYFVTCAHSCSDIQLAGLIGTGLSTKSSNMMGALHSICSFTPRFEGSNSKRASHIVQVFFKLLFTSAEVLLVKASDMDKPRVSGGGEYTRTDILRGIKSHYRNNKPLYHMSRQGFPNYTWLFISLNQR